jgi:transglutaminase-like putative cysteine protease
MTAVARPADVGRPLAPGGARRTAAAAAGVQERPWLRLCAFAALGGYGLERWGTLLHPAPGWRLAGLLALAVALAGGVPALARRDRVVAALVGLLMLLVAFPIAGLRWRWFIHLRVRVGAEAIGTGLTRLPDTLVPYLGHSPDVRLVIVLGAAVLVLDAAAVLAFTGWAGAPLGDGRRAAAALPLTALAVVPSTLVRPQWPYVQGLLLFVLLAAFLWGERVRRQSAASAVLAVTIAGVAAAIAAPHLDERRPWINYRAWAGSIAHRRVDVFDWNQTYGPLRWPHAGHEVLTVRAHSADYWKAENLDTFNGYAWVASPPGDEVSRATPLPAPERSALARWTQTLQVTIRGMTTDNVIAAGTAGLPLGLPGGVGAGSDPGTWVTGASLGPGTSYLVSTYSPHPSHHQLATAGRRYPGGSALAPYLTLTIPVDGLPAGASPQVQFPLFGAGGQGGRAISHVPGPEPTATDLVRNSPYAGAYALARRLAAGSATPFGLLTGVERYLAGDFTYDQNPPVARYPLESFLFGSREGYCQQFSGAMAMLLRMGGVPARVATGFTSGTYDRSAQQWVVTDRDAHAWVEAWFPKYGWVRFDPTPVTAPARGGSTSASITKGVRALPGSVAAAPRRDAGGPSSSPAATHHPQGGGVSAWAVVIGVVAGGAVAGLLALLMRLPGRPEDLVEELERALARTRRPLAEHITLAVLEHRLHASPGAEAYVRTLRMARYGGRADVPTAAQRRALRRELARGLGLPGRVRAWWALPPRLRRPGQPSSTRAAGAAQS